MSENRNTYLKKPLAAWSNHEIMTLVGEVNKRKNTSEAQPYILQHMSLGTYRRALKRVGLLPIKLKRAQKANAASFHDKMMALGDALVAVLMEFEPKAQK